MKAIDRFSQELADRIFVRAKSQSFMGQRLLATGFPDEVLMLSADKLALLASRSASETLMPENVLFVLKGSEYDSIEDRRKNHQAYQAGLSYCVNVRDRGETAVFFVRRSLVPFVDESLKEKGSVLLANVGITKKRILSQTVEAYIRELEWADEDHDKCEKAKALVFESCKRLLEDERSEMLCFDLLDSFFRLSLDEALEPIGYKTLGLVPAVDEQDPNIGKNIYEIERLREALAVPSKRGSYLSEHEEYDPEVYGDFEKFLIRQRWRVPLSTVDEGKKYLEFFQAWPDSCNLAFLECAEEGSARLDIVDIKGGSGRKFEQFGSYRILDEHTLIMEWQSSNLEGTAGDITVDGQPRVFVSQLEQNRMGPIHFEQMLLPIGEPCVVKIRPQSAAARRRLQRGCRNSAKIVKLDQHKGQGLILFGREQILLVNDDDRELTFNITPPPSMSVAINSRVFKGYQPIGAAVIQDEDSGEAVSSITFEEGESVFLRVDWQGKSEPTKLEIVGQEAAPDAPKMIDSVLKACRDARGKLDRFSEGGIELEEEWQTFPHFNIICKRIPDFLVRYEATTTWTHDLLLEVLEEPEILGPRAVLISTEKVEVASRLLDTKDGIPWEKPWSDQIVEEFLESRSKLFDELEKADAPIPFIRLSSLEELVIKYATNYFKLLKKFLDQNDSYTEGISCYSQIDTFYPVETARLPFEGKVSDAEINNGILLLAPTHPIRLLWLLQREKLSFRLLQSPSDRQVLNFLDAFDGLGFPSNIVLPNGSVFYNATNPENAFWGVYAPENMPFDRVLTLLSWTFPRERARFDNPLVPDPKKVYAALDYSHRVLPYRDTLRIAYSNPGSAQCMTDALKQLRKTAEGQKELHHALFNREKTRFRVNLIGPGGMELGESFSKTIRDGEREALPSKLEVQSSEIENAPLRYVDLSFADDIANRKHGSLLSTMRCPPVLPVEGLICPLISRSRIHENATGDMLFAFIHPASDLKKNLPQGPENTGENLIAGLCHLYQAIFSEPKPGAIFGENNARAFKVEYRQDTINRVRQLQSFTNFLFTLDTNADLAMYEAMAAAGESIIIDFDPAYHNPIAKLFSKTSHNYVITTSRNSPVKKKLRSVVSTIVGDETAKVETGINKLFSVLNGLSGRFLKELLQNPTDVKETIGCGLSSLLVQSLMGKMARDNSTKVGKLASVLIPIDDHFNRWKRLSGRKDRTENGERADLLFVTVHVPTDMECVEAWPRILEVKLGYHGQSNISQRAYTQISNTWQVISEWLRLEPLGRDSRTAKFKCGDTVESLFKVLDLASIFDFYLRRATRLAPMFIQNFTNIEEYEDFCNIVYGLMVKGKIEFLFDMREPVLENPDLAEGEGIIAGHILHFDPEITEDPPKEEKGLRPTVIYQVIGRKSCRRLLTEDW